MKRENLYQQIRQLIKQKKKFKPFWKDGDVYLGLGEILTIEEMEKFVSDPNREVEIVIFDENGESIIPLNK